jgi:hypothetical protein
MSSAHDSQQATTEPAAATGPAEVQDALVSAIKAYAAMVEDHPELPPFRDDLDLTQTEVALVASRLLHRAQIEFFELAIFDSWHTMNSSQEQHRTAP